MTILYYMAQSVFIFSLFWSIYKDLVEDSCYFLLEYSVDLCLFVCMWINAVHFCSILAQCFRIHSSCVLEFLHKHFTAMIWKTFMVKASI